jgi:predicted phosphodiesterase
MRSLVRGFIFPLGLLAAGCAIDPPPAPARVVFIADTHVIGPQYTEPRESSPADNESIFLTVDRLLALREAIHAIAPRPKAVFVLGDVVHDAHHSHDFEWYLENDSAFSVASEIFASFEMPVHFVFGNHDYHVRCGAGESYDRALSNRLFEHFFESAPYDHVDLGGFRLLLMNGQLGPTWDREDPRCATETASFGEDQLLWAREKLQDRIPTIVLAHHMSILHLADEAPSLEQPDLMSLLRASPHVGALFVGHTHRWIDLRVLHSRLEEYVVAASRYDADNFWVVELDGANGRFEILDREKAIAGSTCARTFDYSSEAYVEVPEAEEEGTCVVGLEG